jgi:hypothetical protein
MAAPTFAPPAFAEPAPEYAEPAPEFAAPATSALAPSLALPAPPAEVIESIPPGVPVATPLVNIPPNALNAVLPTENVARLTRGEDVLEIRSSALFESGLFDRAIASSPALSRQLQFVEHKVLIEQQTRAQQFMMRSQAAQLKRALDDTSIAAAAQLERAADSMEPTVQKASQDSFEARFQLDEAVRYYGLNGAQVAAVEKRSDTLERLERPELPAENYVLIKAMSPEPENNLGYSITKIYKTGEVGHTQVPSEYLLPMPADSNDLFYDRLSPALQRMPDGMMFKATELDRQNPIVRLLGMPRLGFFYDTGFLLDNDRTNFAERVSLQGSSDPAAGQTFFLLSNVEAGQSVTTPFDLLLDAQVLDVGDHTAQVFFDANNDRQFDELDTEHLGVRAYNRQLGSFFEGWSLVIGQVNTVFVSNELKPAGLENSRTLVGSVDRTNRQISQIAVHAPLSNMLVWKTAVEESYDGDLFFAPSSNETILRRWPTLVSNIAWEDRACNNSVQVGALARTLGFQAADGAEHFATGYGLAGLGQLGNRWGAAFVGAAGGRGVGDYVQGIRHSAVADAGSLEAVDGLGAFVGQQFVSRNRVGQSVAELNVAYGYAWMDTPALLGDSANRKLHQGWINYSRFLSDYFAVGVEYQYGYRQVPSGDEGEDHRVMLILALRSGPTKERTEAEGNAMIDRRPVQEVVRQDQRGGTAYAQRL